MFKDLTITIQDFSSGASEADPQLFDPQNQYIILNVRADGMSAVLPLGYPPSPPQYSDSVIELLCKLIMIEMDRYFVLYWSIKPLDKPFVEATVAEVNKKIALAFDLERMRSAYGDIYKAIEVVKTYGR